MIGIVICHKNLARELITTAKAIIGHHHNLFPFSNDKSTAEQLVQEIETFIESKGNPEEIIIMVDLRGGNCWAIARMVAHSHPKRYVLSGVNLPMLFSFLTKKDVLPLPELLEKLQVDAHRGIFLDE